MFPTYFYFWFLRNQLFIASPEQFFAIFAAVEHCFCAQ